METNTEAPVVWVSHKRVPMGKGDRICWCQVKKQILCLFPPIFLSCQLLCWHETNSKATNLSRKEQCQPVFYYLNDDWFANYSLYFIICWHIQIFVCSHGKEGKTANLCMTSWTKWFWKQMFALRITSVTTQICCWWFFCWSRGDTRVSHTSQVTWLNFICDKLIISILYQYKWH